LQVNLTIRSHVQSKSRIGNNVLERSSSEIGAGFRSPAPLKPSDLSAAHQAGVVRDDVGDDVPGGSDWNVATMTCNDNVAWTCVAVVGPIRPWMGVSRDLLITSSFVGVVSTSLPFLNTTPARTSATRSGAFTARQRLCADSMSLNARRIRDGAWVAELTALLDLSG